MAVVTGLNRPKGIFSGIECSTRIPWDERFATDPGKIIMVSGPSGVGKTTLIRNFIASQPETASATVSETTRGPRKSDLLGEYRHWSREEFLRLGEKAWEIFAHGQYYATLTHSFRLSLLMPGVHLLNCIPLIPENLPAQFLLCQRVIPFFIVAPPEPVLRRRFAERGDNLKIVEERLSDCRGWNEWAENSHIGFHKIDGALGKAQMLEVFTREVGRLVR